MNQEQFNTIFNIVVTILAVGVTAVCCIPFGVIGYKIFQVMTYRKTEAEIIGSRVHTERVIGEEARSVCFTTYAYAYKGIPYETTIETVMQKQRRKGKIRHSRSNPKKIFKPGGLLVAIYCAGPAALVLFLVILASNKLFGP
jgi:hypothetical protein